MFRFPRLLGKKPHHLKHRDLRPEGASVRMGIRDFLPATALVSVCILWLAVATLRPQPDQMQIGVVFPPNYSGQDVLSRVADAGGRLVREGAWPFIAVVAADDARVLARLDELGALFTVNPLALGGCLTRPAATAPS